MPSPLFLLRPRLAVLVGGVFFLALDTAPSWGGETAAYDEVLKQVGESQRKQDWPAAASALEEALKLNPTVARHWWELGLAQARAKKQQLAIDAFRRANELGCGFNWDPVFFIPRGEAYYQIACCHAELGENDTAIEAAAQAIAAGLRRPRRLMTEARLASLRADPRLLELAGAIDFSNLSRDESYRAELKFLAREMFRLHFNPYHELPRDRFDAEIKALDEEIPQLSDEQIAVRYIKLLCLLRDGHTQLMLKSAHVVPVQFFWFDEGLFVSAVRPGHERLLGSQVLKIGDRDIAEVIKAFDPIVPRDNEMTVRSFTPSMLRVTQLHIGLGLQSDPSALDLTVKLPNGSEEKVRLAAETRRERTDYDRESWLETPPGDGPIPLSWKNRDKMLAFEPIRDGKVVLATINGMGNPRGEPFAKFTERLLEYVDQHPEVERLILDFRYNGGGNTFLNPPLIHGLVSSRLNKRGGLVVLIGRETFSAAQNTVTEIERHTEALFIGEPTGSRPNFIGESVHFPLPYSNHGVSISDLYWGTSSPLDRRMWLEPHYYVAPRAADFLARRDPALDAAIAWEGK